MSGRRKEIDERRCVRAYQAGATMRALAERFKVSPTKISDVLRRHGIVVMPRGDCQGGKGRPAISSAERDWKRLAKAIPEDTRNFTQRFFNDPLPGRSALDKMKAQEAA